MTDVAQMTSHRYLPGVLSASTGWLPVRQGITDPNSTEPDPFVEHDRAPYSIHIHPSTLPSFVTFVCAIGSGCPPQETNTQVLDVDSGTELPLADWKPLDFPAAGTSSHLSRAEVTARLAEFGRLPADWDSYGAEPISSTAIERARTLLARLREWFAPIVGDCYLPMNVAPVAAGGVQLEWESGGRALEVEIGSDGMLGYLRVDRTGGTRTTESGDNASEIEVLKYVTSLLPA